MIVDLILIAFGAIMLILGIISGFSRQLVAVIEIALLVAAIFLAGVLGQALFYNNEGLTSTGKTASGWFQSVGDSIPAGDVEIDITDATAVSEALVEGGIPEFVASIVSGPIADMTSVSEYDFSTLGEYVAAYLGLLVIKAIIFVILLILLIVGSSIARKGIKKTEVLNPSFRRLNRLIGALTSVVIAYVVVSILFGAIKGANLPESIAKPCIDMISEGGLSSWLYNNNFIGNLFFKTTDSESSLKVVNLISDAFLRR